MDPVPRSTRPLLVGPPSAGPDPETSAHARRFLVRPRTTADPTKWMGTPAPLHHIRATNCHPSDTLAHLPGISPSAPQLHRSRPGCHFVPVDDQPQPPRHSSFSHRLPQCPSPPPGPRSPPSKPHRFNPSRGTILRPHWSPNPPTISLSGDVCLTLRRYAPADTVATASLRLRLDLRVWSTRGISTPSPVMSCGYHTLAVLAHSHYPDPPPPQRTGWQCIRVYSSGFSIILTRLFALLLWPPTTPPSHTAAPILSVSRGLAWTDWGAPTYWMPGATLSTGTGRP